MKEKMSDSLLRYIDAGRPLIYINHFDFETVDRMLAEAFPKATIAEYCDADGWVDFKTKQPHGSTPYTLPEFLMLFNNDQLYQDRKEYLVVLKEIHDSIGDKQVYSLLQSIARRKFMRGDSKGYNVTVLIVDSKLVIPPELEKLITMVELRPPQEEEIRELTRKAFSQPQIKDWYSGAWQLFNECDIIWQENGALRNRRPDRVMMRDGVIVVVDFKFGKPNKKYNKQVQGYIELLVRMGYDVNTINGYLWYVEEEIIEKV